MFVKAIEEVSNYTRPIHTIMRSYGSNKVFPGASTLFFVNNEGDAVTCRHVAELLIKAEQINQQYLLFTQARFRLKNDELHQGHLAEIESQFSYAKETLVQMKHTFFKCFDRITSFDCKLHPTADLAVIQFKGFQNKYFNGHARFFNSNTPIQQGRSLCRLGYPFPEFSNFQHNYQTDDIEWTREGNANSPSFPIDGIVTRLIAQNGKLSGVEMSTPGLRGQSGGPLFDADGVVYGMQSSTRHLHLGFDLENFEINHGSQTKRITNTPFLHVGQCVHVDVIKDFLITEGISYSVA